MATFIAATILALGILCGLALLALYLWRRDLYDRYDRWWRQPPWWRALALYVSSTMLFVSALAILSGSLTPIWFAMGSAFAMVAGTLIQMPWQEPQTPTTAPGGPAALRHVPVLWPLAPELVVTLLGMAMAGLLLGYVVLLTVRH